MVPETKGHWKLSVYRCLVAELPKLVTSERDHCLACNYWYPGCICKTESSSVILEVRILDVSNVTSTHLVVLPLICAGSSLLHRELHPGCKGGGSAQQLAQVAECSSWLAEIRDQAACW